MIHPATAGAELASSTDHVTAMKTLLALRVKSRFLDILLSFTASLTLPAQTVAPAAKTVTAANEPVVELSPFTVTSTNDRGYRAENTLAGSRLDSSLKDTPGVLDVLTKDFLDDLGATTLEQALAFSTNFA
jgi:iron complex outermembrane receptor protein